MRKKDILKKIREADIPPYAKEFLEISWDTVEIMTDYDKAQSFEEFLGYKISRTTYQEILRKIIGKYEK